MQTTAALGFADRRDRLSAALVALADVSRVLFQASGPELTTLMTQLDEVRRLSSAAQVAVTAEAAQRGEIAASTSPGLTAWVRSHAPTTTEGGAGDIAACAAAAGSSDVGLVGAAAIHGEFSPRTGATILREREKLRHEVKLEALGAVTDALMQMGRLHGPAGARMVRPELLARFASTAFQDDQDKRSQRVELTSGRERDGLHDYDLTLDNESRAILEAAIGALSKPVPGPDGERDKRTLAQRRGQALVEALRRGLSSDVLPGASTKSTVVVVIDAENLQAGEGGGRVIGGLDGGQLLGAETVRKLSCDGRVMGLVRDSFGRVLDAGRAERFVTREMLKALWVRDQQCTYRGCTAPAFWCDGHHLIHWIDGGETSLDNSALLCGGHHTIVHRDRLAGQVLDGEVVWDYTAGSYDRLLERRRQKDPPGGVSDIDSQRNVFDDEWDSLNTGLSWDQALRLLTDDGSPDFEDWMHSGAIVVLPDGSSVDLASYV